MTPQPMLWLTIPVPPEDGEAYIAQATLQVQGGLSRRDYTLIGEAVVGYLDALAAHAEAADLHRPAP